MDLGLKGRRAIVTGGTRGIGRAIVARLADEGVRVGFCARDSEAVASVAAALGQSGAEVHGEAVDVANDAQVAAWVSRTEERLGGLDIVVTNVSAVGSALGPKLGDEGWRRGFDIDIMGAVHTIEAAMPHLERSEAASIVVISSIVALESLGGVRPHSAIKAALINYTSHLATEFAAQGIRANTVTPGTIYASDGLWGQREREEPEAFQLAVSRNPMGRLGRPEEVANAVAFLASPAASFVSGANLVVDGAMSRRVQY